MVDYLKNRVRFYLDQPPTKPAKKDARLQTAEYATYAQVFTLFLSIFHTQEAVSMLTGSGVLICFGMAIAIDVALMVCERGEHLAATSSGQRWAVAGIIIGIGLSMYLNVIAFREHATDKPAATALGVAVPAIIFILGRVSSSLRSMPRTCRPDTKTKPKAPAKAKS